MRRLLPIFLVVVMLSTACARSRSEERFASADYGTVIGSLEVELASARRSDWDGFFEVNLAAREPDYRFRFASSEGGEGAVDVVAGEPQPFVVALPPGRAVLEDVELVLYDGPVGWPLGLVSLADGKRIPVDLEFDVEPGRITYIGRVHVKLPKRLQLFAPKSRVTVADASAQDYTRFDSLFEGSELPVATVLAQRSPAE